ncbi:MAG: hypothetical protein HY291_01210 [Planctomycetes bacterium]|nr:hypothetical protein [Planctomycetota bacterium]
MPIEYTIDHKRRLVLACGRGVLTEKDFFGYQREVWSRPEVAGYDELVDMNAVERIVDPTPEQIQDLARLSASMDAGGASAKFAIVASKDLAYGLGRMYEIYRGLNKQSTKDVAVFRTREEACAYLGIADGPADAKESQSA